MKKLLFVGIALCVMALPAFAQGTNFSGKWVLDLSKSKVNERSRITEQTITVTHTGIDFKRDTATTRTPPPGGGQGMAGRGGFGGGDGVESLKLDGKEVTSDIETPMGTGKMAKKAEIKNGKLMITSTRSMGEFTTTTREEWSLSADGKTLTIKSDVETPRGTMSTEMVYNKN